MTSQLRTLTAPMPEKPALRLGFVPLTDCAPLVVAHEMGFFTMEGLEVTLSREASWANVRDKVSLGALDGAQMLAAMPLAATAGTGLLDRPMLTACVLSRNGNAITLSEALYRRLVEIDPEGMAGIPCTARPLARLIAADRAAGRPKLTFAVVFPWSTHAYELRFWMAAAGIDPDRDVVLTVVPPPQMVAHFQAGSIDGCCVGEPWNSLAVARGVGRILIASPEIWPGRAEKVLGVTATWADRHPATHRALIRALIQACRWLDEPAHRARVPALLARPGYLDVPAEIIARSLSGLLPFGPDGAARSLPDMHVFHAGAANFPWTSQALWYGAQMVRWGQLDDTADLPALVAASCRPDLFREAAGDLRIPCPAEDARVEGGRTAPWLLEQAGGPIPMPADRFFSGAPFDPADPLACLADGSIANPRPPAAAAHPA